jgi:hypothetical protein
MRLIPYHEVVGTLSAIKNEKNQVKLVFTICKEIEIPESAIPKDELQAAIGKRVGIFHSGSEGYRIRKVKG